MTKATEPLSRRESELINTVCVRLAQHRVTRSKGHHVEATRTMRAANDAMNELWTLFEWPSDIAPPLRAALFWDKRDRVYRPETEQMREKGPRS